jgi:ketosteroid isomerase-like protein
MIADDRVTTSSVGQPIDVVRRFNALWAAGEIEASMQLVAEHAVYRLHISEDLLPIGGETVGRANIEAGLRLARQQFHYLLYRPLDVFARGNDVRHQVEFMYRHQASGELLSGRFRMVMRVEDGLITRAEEYHDRAKVEAFLRLFGS